MNPATILLLIQLTELIAEVLQNSKLGQNPTPEQIKAIEERQKTAIAAWKAAINK